MQPDFRREGQFRHAPRRTRVLRRSLSDMVVSPRRRGGGTAAAIHRDFSGLTGMLSLTAVILVLLLLGSAPLGQAEQPQAVTLKGHAGWVGAVAFAPDGKTLASAGA